ncbi:hypothetical protein ACOSP6_06280 [Tenacibaculum sp. MEBiC06402]|uniref:hypothetical protein n=1 Tax=unclassified Tenacibaculum TaxID=2635139 RepID=UPI003B9B2328
MKTRILTLYIIVLSTISYAQHVPSFKIKDNPTFGMKAEPNNSIENGKKTFNYYLTLTMIEKLKLEKKEKKFDSISKNALIQLHNEVIGAVNLSSEQIDAYEKQLKSAQDSLAIIQPKLDTLSNKYQMEELQLKKASILSFNAKRARAFFDILHDNQGKRFSVLNNTGFTIGNNSGSIYSELVSGNLSVLRVSLGAMISSSSSDNQDNAQQEEAYQRLVSNGGNTVLNIQYPLAYIHSSNNQFNFISRLQAKGTADFPEFGTTTDDFAGSASFGIDFYADAALTNNQLRFFGTFNYNQVFGTGEFSKNLGIDNSNFTFGQLTLGLVFNNIKLSFIVATLSSESSLENKSVVAGGQVLH